MPGDRPLADDTALVREVAAGSQSALGDLYDRHVDAVYAAASRLTSVSVILRLTTESHPSACSSPKRSVTDSRLAPITSARSWCDILTFSAIPPGVATPDRPSSETGPTIFIALQEQLGLKLESTKEAVPVLVIDSVNQPSPN